MIHLPLKLASAASVKAQLFLWPFNWANHGEACLPTVSVECAFPVDWLCQEECKLKDHNSITLSSAEAKSKAEQKADVGRDIMSLTNWCILSVATSIGFLFIINLWHQTSSFLLSIWNFSCLGDRLLVRWHVPDQPGATVGKLEPFLSPTSTNV